MDAVQIGTIAFFIILGLWSFFMLIKALTRKSYRIIQRDDNKYYIQKEMDVGWQNHTQPDINTGVGRVILFDTRLQADKEMQYLLGNGIDEEVNVVAIGRKDYFKQSTKWLK